MYECLYVLIRPLTANFNIIRLLLDSHTCETRRQIGCNGSTNVISRNDVPLLRY